MLPHWTRVHRGLDETAGESTHEIGAEEEAHEFGALNTLLFVAVLAVCILCAYLIKKHRVYYLHESAAIVMVGILVGGLARLFLPSDEVDFLTFQPELFYFLLLPPIIFEAGYTLRRKHFFQNFFAIVLYAVFGTLLSTFLIGYLTLTVGRLGIVSSVSKTDIMEAIMFGSAISAVDPVATLSIIGDPQMKCDPLLYSLLFGESVLNDAVSIVLFKAFLKLYESRDQWGSLTVAMAMASFIGVSLGSVIVGAVVGLSFSYLCKNTDLHLHPHSEVSLLFLFGYGSYALAEAIELSGIMALFVCGVVLAHYNSYNLSATARAAVENTSRTLRQMAEYFVYLYMGMGFFTGRFVEWNATFIVCSILFCLFARLFNVFPASLVINQWRAEGKKIPLQTQVVMWFAGLRGAVAFALAQNMPRGNRDLYATTTLCVVIFTTIVCGGLTEPILEAAGMKTEVALPAKLSREEDESDSDSAEELTPLTKGGSNIHALWWSEQYDSKHGGVAVREHQRRRFPTALRNPLNGSRRDFHSFWRELDSTYLKPVFGGSLPVQEACTSPLGPAEPDMR